MGYYINIEKITLDDFKNILKSADLIPSRMVLKENINANFDILKHQNYKNIDEILNNFKNKKKIHDFSEMSGLNENYLTILVREIKGYRQKPNKIKDFPCITEKVALKFENIGIKNTFQLYDKLLTPEKRREISEQIEVDEKEILKITKLTDLCRIRWVNHTFAYVLHEAKYDTVEKVQNADYKELYATIKLLNKEKKLYKGIIGKNDMKRCVDGAKNLSLDVKY